MANKNKPFDKDYIKDLQNQLLEDKYEIKRLIHDYGPKDFLVLASETMYNLGNELEDSPESEDYINWAESLEIMWEE